MNRTPFNFQPPSWVNTFDRTLSPDEALERADAIATSYYALATQTEQKEEKS